MTITYTEDDTTRVAEIRVLGRITRADYDQAVEPLQAFIDRHDQIRLLEIIERFEGFDASAIWPGIKFDFKNLRHISHVAVVSDIGWLLPLSKAAGAVISTKLRTFDMEQIDEARRWITEA